jgi:RimJ/RimL family protein N-acetyltransferase
MSADQLPTLTTERLRLRWLTPADAPALFAIFGDPEVCRYWGFAVLPDLAAAGALQRQIESHFADGSLYQWGVAERDTGHIIGTCTLASITREHHRAEIGFALARAFWGKGFMSEALPALLRHAFGEMELHRIEADVDPRNLASMRLLERLGFQREGYLRERHHMNGEIQDAVLYGLLRHEWRSE